MLHETRRLKHAAWWTGAAALFAVAALAGFGVVEVGRPKVDASPQPKLRSAGQYSASQPVPPVNRMLTTPPVSVQMFDAQTGYGSAPNHPVALTHDSGATWTDATPQEASLAAKTGIVKGYFLDNQTGWTFVLRPATDVTVYATRDGGRSWSKLATLPVRYGDGNMSIAFSDAQHGWFEELTAGMGQHAGELFATSNGGRTWTKVAEIAPRDSAPFGGQLTAQKEGVLWVNASQRAAASVGGPGFVWLSKSADAGKTWTQVSLPVPAVNQQDTTAVSQPAFWGDAGLVSVLYSSGSAVLYASDDGGQDWTVRGTLPTGAWPVFADAQHGWQTDGRLLYRTQDGGRSWERLAVDPVLQGVLPGRRVSQLNFPDAQHGWAVLEGIGPNVKTALLTTRDGGETWKKL